MMLLPLQLLTVAVTFVLRFQVGDAVDCPNTSATANTTKPLYLVSLVPATSRFQLAGLSGMQIAQDEINNRADLLPGYRIELLTAKIEDCYADEAGIGLSNLVKYTVSPPCRPVVAVVGLPCSSHTSLLSPVASHDGYDLIQMSIANSPIFQTQNHRFPHLWRLVGSAAMYSDAILAMMNQFHWTRVGIVYDTGSVFHYEIARYTVQSIRESSNKSIAFSIAVRGTKSYYFDAVVSQIKSKETTILVSMLSTKQLSALLSKTYHNGMVYPQYAWIHIEKSRNSFIRDLGVSFIQKYLLGHIFLWPARSLNNGENFRLVSNKTFRGFLTRYLNESKRIHKQENITGYPTITFIGSKFYDEMWAIALAVNKSLPILKQRNMSLDKYTIGQPEITAVIEEQLAKVHFQGAGGWVEFDRFQSASSPMKACWILRNGSEKLLDTFDLLNSSEFHLDLKSSDLPRDTVPRKYVYVLISFPMAILLYILTGVVIMFTTVQLILYLYYRNHKMIKATSPYLSLLMFAGCYLFCIAALQLNTFSSFLLPPTTFMTMVIVNFILVTNGISLILLTLFVKQLRLNRIFLYWTIQDLGKVWSNISLTMVILLISIIANAGLAVLITLRPPHHCNYSYKFLQQGNYTVIKMHTRIEPISNYTFICLAALYTNILLVMVFLMGISNRKIKMKNFNTSGQIYLLIAVLIITIWLAVSHVILFLVKEQEPAANVTMTLLFLVFVTACEVILFTPKVLQALVEQKFPRLLTHLQKVLSFAEQAIFA